MKKVILICALLLSVQTLFAQEKNFLDQNYIEVTGRANVELVPDEIYIGITLDEKDSKGKISLAEQEKAMFRTLKPLNLDLDKNMSVQDMSSDFETFVLRKNSAIASKSYQLKVNSAQQLNAVFQALDAINVSQVTINRMALSNIEQVRDQVRVQSAKNAQQRADLLAGAVGQKAGKALYIQDFDNSARMYDNVVMSRATKVSYGAEESQPMLEFQKIKIEHSVQIRFALE